MEMTSAHKSGYKWITRMKKKLSCMGETSPINSGGFVPFFLNTARCSRRVTGLWLWQWDCGTVLVRQVSVLQLLHVMQPMEIPACAACLWAPVVLEGCFVGILLWSRRAERTRWHPGLFFWGSDYSLVYTKHQTTSETKPIGSYHNTAFLANESSDVHPALLLSPDLTVLLCLRCQWNPLSLYIYC